MSADLTIIMPLRNCWDTMGIALKALGRAVRGIPIKLLMMENESTDMTGDICRSERLSPVMVGLGLTNYEVLPTQPCSNAIKHHQRMYENLTLAWDIFIAKVDTPLLMRLNGDVGVSHNSINLMLAGMKADAKLGAYGVDYPRVPGGKVGHDHLSTGCTMYRTEALKSLGPIGYDDRCDCRWINRELRARGWTVDTVPMAFAKHIG